MATKRTAESWTQYLNSPDRELTLEEYAAAEAQHVCDHTREVLERTEKSMLELEQINGRLNRLERFLQAATSYPMPSLTNGRQEH